jgi:hypothetical protein
MKQTITAMALTGLLAATPALAAESKPPPSRPPVAPLPAGKAAGLAGAQQKPVLGLALVGSAGVIAVIAVVAAGGGGNASVTPQNAPATGTGE